MVRVRGNVRRWSLVLVWVLGASILADDGERPGQLFQVAEDMGERLAGCSVEIVQGMSLKRVSPGATVADDGRLTLLIPEPGVYRLFARCEDRRYFITSDLELGAGQASSTHAPMVVAFKWFDPFEDILAASGAPPVRDIDLEFEKAAGSRCLVPTPMPPRDVAGRVALHRAVYRWLDRNHPDAKIVEQGSGPGAPGDCPSELTGGVNHLVMETNGGQRKSVCFCFGSVENSVIREEPKQPSQ